MKDDPIIRVTKPEELEDFKVLRLVDGEFQLLDWGRTLQIEEHRWGRRLWIGTDEPRIPFFLRLIERYNEPFGLTFVVEDDLDPRNRARYLAPQRMNLEQVRYFLNHFEEFLTKDGRHHVYVSTIDGSGTVVYDQHDYFFVYGRIDQLAAELEAEGYTHGVPDFPQHSHTWRHDIKPGIVELMSYFPWRKYPLEAVDVYGREKNPLKKVVMKIRAWWHDRNTKCPK